MSTPLGVGTEGVVVRVSLTNTVILSLVAVLLTCFISCTQYSGYSVQVLSDYEVETALSAYLVRTDNNDTLLIITDPRCSGYAKEGIVTNVGMKGDAWSTIRLRPVSNSDSLRIEYSIDTSKNEMVTVVFYEVADPLGDSAKRNFGGYVQTFTIPFIPSIQERIIECLSVREHNR